MFLTDRYPECMVEYRVGMDDVIECVGENIGSGILGEIEKRVDIARAKATGCKGAKEICDYLNGES